MEFIKDNWDKLAAFIFGGGVVYGVGKSQLSQITSRLKEHDEAFLAIDERIEAAEAELTEHMLNCPTKIHEKLNRIAEDVSFMRGMLAGKKDQ